MAPRHILFAIAIVCGLVRAGHLLAVQGTPFFAAHRIWPASDMYIFDQWAQRIVGGDPLGRVAYHPVLDWMSGVMPPDQWRQWFGDAPVFFKAPLYAYLVALLRWLVGDPALPMAVLQIGASMVSAGLLFLVTERLFGAAAGLLAALAFAVYGPAVHYDVVMLRGPWIILAALLVAWCLLRVRERLTPMGAVALGFIIGVSILLNESFAVLPLLVLATFGCWARSFSRWTASSAAFLGGLGIALAPLVVRNVAVGAPPMQVAVTGAWVVALSNASDSDPIFFGYPPPSFVPLMQAADARLGRVLWLSLRSFDGVGQIVGFYLRRAAGLIAPFENADNASFYYARINNPLMAWLPDYAWLFPLLALGIVLAIVGERPRPIAALVPVWLTLLASNLLVPPLSRYRLSLIVLAMPFAGLTLARIWRWVVQRRVVALGGVLAAIIGLRLVADLVERRVVLADATPWTHVYRMAEFRLAATEYERQGRFHEASAEYLALAALVPRGSRRWVRALLLATPLQARAGERAAARASADAATELAPPDPRMLLAIGDAYWRALGDPVTAATVYRRAEELQPEGPVLQELRARQRALEAFAPPVTPPSALR